ncbi:hypothetical protein EV143_104398 [Flavobacterium chryseum]|nr:hypothetical protein [Flavobacterium sp. P3160]TDO77631.1 hypothetical protein EV143_104398 [Flavobacterium sp. P3160]
MNLDTERANRMFNLFMIAFIIAFVIGFGLGAFATWLVCQI